MTRRATKIVATLGPASSDPVLLEQMIRAGVNVVRLNFSHGKAQDHIDRATLVRAAAGRVLFQAGDATKLDWLVLESAKAKGEERIPFENELEALHLSDEARRAILTRAGIQ